jgi:hypothetical protein
VTYYVGNTRHGTVVVCFSLLYQHLHDRPTQDTGFGFENRKTDLRKMKKQWCRKRYRAGRRLDQ